MIYKIRDSKRKNMLEAYDNDENLVGEAVMSVFTPSDIYEKPRLCIYIDIEAKGITEKKEIKDQLFDEIMKRSRIIKEDNKEVDVQIYHCCFADNKENIEYYSTKKGFNHDEGMYIVRKEIKEKCFNTKDIGGVEFVKIDFKNNDELKELVERQNEVFISGYSITDLKDLKNENQCFSIAAKHKGKIVGNIVMVVKEDEIGIKYGWVDDLFVSKEWRKHGIGEKLLLSAMENLRGMNIKESRLEVWSTNRRAMSIYNNVGYEFYKETEVAIGMFL